MNAKILKRMKALLAMAEDASNENESEIAMRRLHSMLAKYNISISDIASSGEANPVDQDYFESYARPWQKTIIIAISKLYFCDMYMMGGRRKRFCIVGTEVNRTFAISMAKTILHTTNVHATLASKSVYPGQQTRQSSFQTSFLNSAAATIWARCNELIESSKHGNAIDDDGSKLPVMASVYDRHQSAIDEFMSDIGLIKGRSMALKSTDKAGHNAGTNYGNNVQLTRSIQKQNAQKQLA